jgi:penicillin-binding protein 1C
MSLRAQVAAFAGSRRVRTAAAVLATVAGVAWLVARSRFLSPEPTYLVRDRHDRFLGEVGPTADSELGYWPVDAIPERVVAATIAVEDRRFWQHPGVDPVAVARAIRGNVASGRRISGASTIAMQVARMQYPGSRTYLRKATEAVTALLLTLRHGRREVLAQYLNLVSYGNRIHGIRYAARRYFDKPVEDLSWAEIAFLAAIPQSPAHMNPFVPSGRARAVKRGAEILALLRAQGTLTADEHALSLAQLQDLAIPPPSERPREAMHAVLRYERELRAAAPRTRGPLVRTTLDLELQQRVEWTTFDAVRSWEAQGARNAAVILVDRESNEVRACVGSTGFFDPAHAGAIDYTAVPRSPGSALKPFIYALALERGTITPATILDDLQRGAGGIANADDSFLGPLLPRVALASSRNVPAADLLDRVGLATGYDFLRDLGLHDGEKPAHRYGLGLAIGGLPVTLERLVRAYGVLSSDGLLRDLRWYAAAPATEPRRLLSEETAREITLFLSDPSARLPAFARMGATEYPFPVAVKTGTSSRFRDSWALAYSKRYLVGVWVGDPDFRPMNRLSGYRGAAELVHRILTDLHRDQLDGLAAVSWPAPRGFRAVRLCALTGHRATDACDRVVTEWMRPGTEPVEACRAHFRVAVDRRSGRIATVATPRDVVDLKTVVDLPPRYAEWAASAGLQVLAPALRPCTTLPEGECMQVRTALRAPAAGTAPASAAESPVVRVSITAPENNLRVLRDPETPADQATLALRAVVEPAVAQVVWYVDGEAYQVADRPYTVRWKLRPGEHVIEARLPNVSARSGRVKVFVE